MCTHCFETSIYKFDSEKDFKEFEAILYSKENIKLIQNQQQYLDHFYSVYHCNYCSANWWFSEPDMAWRGYFIREPEAKQHVQNLKKPNSFNRNGCILVLIIFIIIVVRVVYKSSV